ncbi:unnamed protein product [Plutella xylostella]|uniref:(diamondback moth) hypothetical protein n=1 Tax=Plutella xylostella TaxID=51655 RepID=A0A8S4G816_PLUXY|nr:unnamed protein product [Plutella xylostella]
MNNDGTVAKAVVKLLPKLGAAGSNPAQGEVCVRTSAVVVALAGGAGARVAGKMGGYSNHAHGKSTSGINEEIIWISISMAIAIAVLIAIALCYILKEKCDKRRAYREQSYKEEFAKHALADSSPHPPLDEFPSYTLYPQYSPDGQEYYYNFHRFSYLRDSFKLPPRDYPQEYPVKANEVYITA